MSFRPAPFRHTLLALTVACAGHVGLAHAEAYQLPAGPLAPTLNQIASQAGVTLSIDPALTEGKRSAPVSGDYEAIDALNQALRGTGLQLQGRGTVQPWQCIGTNFPVIFDGPVTKGLVIEAEPCRQAVQRG